MKKIFLSLFIVAGLLWTTSHAQNRIFIKAVGSTGQGSTVGTFDGGSYHEGHLHEIEALAYSDGLAGCANTGGGGGACKVSKTPFTFSMPLSFATISFKYNLLTGKLLTSVDVVLSKEGEGGEFRYYKIHMEGVQVVSVSEGASTESPTFNIELQPERIAWQVINQNSDGSVGPKFSYGWDFSKNKAYGYSFP